MDLSNLGPKPGSRKTGRRVGRGESSGAGKTCGRGGKGQTARTGGKVRGGFEGGQMPLYRRIPKLGFTSRKKVIGLNQYSIINLSVLETFANGDKVDCAALEKKGFVKSRNKAGIKLLGDGTLTKKLFVVAAAASKSAREKIEGLGGKIEIVSANTDSTPNDAA